MLETQRLEVIKAIYISLHCRLHFLKPSFSILAIIARKIHLNIIFLGPSQYPKRMHPHNNALRINIAYALLKRRAPRLSNTHLLETHVLETYHDMKWQITHNSHCNFTIPPLSTSRNKYPQLISVHQPMSVIESRPGAKWSLVNACQLDHPLAGLFAYSAHLMKGPFGYCSTHSVWKLRTIGISAPAVRLALFMLIGLHTWWQKAK